MGVGLQGSRACRCCVGCVVQCPGVEDSMEGTSRGVDIGG